MSNFIEEKGGKPSKPPVSRKAGAGRPTKEQLEYRAKLLNRQLEAKDDDPEIERIKEMFRKVARQRIKVEYQKEKKRIDDYKLTLKKTEDFEDKIDADASYEMIENGDLNQVFIKANAHYSWLIHENNHSLYYAHSSGYVYRVPLDKVKKFGGSSRTDWIRLRPKMKGDTLCVQIDGGWYPMKQIIARHFTRVWRPGYYIYFRDNNPYNCNINNLTIKKYKTGQTLGRHRAIEFLINNKWTRFDSIKKAAGALFVSVSTMKRFVYGWNTKPNGGQGVLNGYEYRFVKKEEVKESNKEEIR